MASLIIVALSIWRILSCVMCNSFAISIMTLASWLRRALAATLAFSLRFRWAAANWELLIKDDDVHDVTCSSASQFIPFIAFLVLPEYMSKNELLQE